MARFSTLKYAEKVLKYFKILGFSAVSIVDGKSVTKPLDCVLVTSCVSFGAFICCLSIIKREELLNSKPTIANYGNFITFFASILIAMISMVFSFVCRHRNWSMLLKIYGIELKARISSVKKLRRYFEYNFFVSV